MSLLFRTSAGNKNQTGENLSKSLSTAVNRLSPVRHFTALHYPLLRDELAPRQVRFAIQSNLWLLTDELSELFREFGVSIGTSLDGLEEINDAQRGVGYFRRTMAGIERARAHGLDVGCICAFTADSAPQAAEVFDFFAYARLNFSIHAALPILGKKNNSWVLAPKAHSRGAGQNLSSGQIG